MGSLDTKVFPIQEYIIRNKWKETIANFTAILGTNQVASALHRPIRHLVPPTPKDVKDVICVASKQVAGARGSA